MNTDKLPQLVTFDGEARSGKGTIVQLTKDYLRDERGYHPMLIDAGQVFRVLVVAATRAGVDVDDPAAIDSFLSDEQNAHDAVQLVKDVYHMSKDERDALLYTNEVGANSAKIGARPLSQYFKDDLLKKWLHDAKLEGYDVVLLDGRALEETGTMLEREGLCDYVLGLYFVCDPVVGAMRTLKFADRVYEQLSVSSRASVDELVDQIKTRNAADQNREVQPLRRPEGAPVVALPDEAPAGSRYYTIDTSAQMNREQMTKPVTDLVTQALS